LDDLEGKAKSVHGYYKDEVQFGIAALRESKKVEERAGTGRNWASRKLFKGMRTATVVFAFAPSGEVTSVSIITAPGYALRDNIS